MADIVGLTPLTNEDIEKLNNKGQIYGSKDDINNGNFVNVNSNYFGDNNTSIGYDEEGRIYEVQQDGSKVAMGWLNTNDINKGNVTHSNIESTNNGVKWADKNGNEHFNSTYQKSNAATNINDFNNNLKTKTVENQIDQFSDSKKGQPFSINPKNPYANQSIQSISTNMDKIPNSPIGNAKISRNNPNYLDGTLQNTNGNYLKNTMQARTYSSTPKTEDVLINAGSGKAGYTTNNTMTYSGATYAELHPSNNLTSESVLPTSGAESASNGQVKSYDNNNGNVTHNVNTNINYETHTTPQSKPSDAMKYVNNSDSGSIIQPIIGMGDGDTKATNNQSTYPAPHSNPEDKMQYINNNN